MMSRNVAGTLNRKPTARATWLVFAAVLTWRPRRVIRHRPAAASRPVPAPQRRRPAPARRRKHRVPGLPTAALLPERQSPGATQGPGKPGHVFVINLENKGYDEVWGAGSAAPYLSKTLRAKGVLLSQYYGIAHNSHPNYLAQISGQASNPMTRSDCPRYALFEQTGAAAPGQVQGTGCVYPSSVPTVAGQLSAAGKTWKGYMEDMRTPCQHPEPGAKDDHQGATVGGPVRHPPQPLRLF